MIEKELSPMEQLPESGEQPEVTATPEAIEQQIEQLDVEPSEQERSEKLAEIKERISRSYQTDKVDSAALPEFLFGDFTGAEILDGKIRVSPEVLQQLKPRLNAIKAKDNFKLPSLTRGTPTATEYDSAVENWSTRTAIIKTADGKRVFAVDSYPSSQIHRWADGLGRRLSGLKFAKVSNKRWKSVFESRSNVPLIENDDPRVVLMPYLPNINLQDLMRRNHEIKDFGECGWAKGLDFEGKQEIIDQAVDRVSETHQRGDAWGEAILNNMIITKEKQVIMCDPETLYDPDVPQLQRMSSDLRDFTFSASAALLKSGDVSDPVGVVKRILDRYGNAEVIEELKRRVGQKPSLIQRIMIPIFERVRLGFSNKREYDNITNAILQYGQEEGKST